RFLDQCVQYETRSRDVELHPWVTWPTVHRGVTDTTHGITHLGQALSDTNHIYPPVWQILAQHGICSGIFGSLQSYPVPSNTTGYAFYVPDMFSPCAATFPDHLSCFQDFNIRMANESSRNISTRLDVRSAARLLARMPRLGI